MTYLTRNSGVLRLLAERKNEVGRYLALAIKTLSGIKIDVLKNALADKQKV